MYGQATHSEVSLDPFSDLPPLSVVRRRRGKNGSFGGEREKGPLSCVEGGSREDVARNLNWRLDFSSRERGGGGREGEFPAADSVSALR